MIEYENECCDCATPLYPCRGESCELRKVPHYFCDECGNEEKLYYADGKMYCLFCMEHLGYLDVVEGSE